MYAAPRFGRLPLGAAIVTLAIAALAWASLCWPAVHPAKALTESDVQFSVTQTPAAAGQTVVLNTPVTFIVAGQVNLPTGFSTLYFDFLPTPGLTFVSSSNPLCALAAGTVTCTYSGPGQGPLPTITLNYQASGTFTTSGALVRMRSPSGDPNPDYASSGDDQFVGSGTINVSPFGPPAKLGFIAQPTSGTAGAVFAAQPTVAIQDTNGTTVTNDTRQITLIANPQSGAAGQLTCTPNGTTINAVAGIASFLGCTIDAPGTYQLIAAPSAGGLSIATGNMVTISAAPGTPTKLAFVAQPSNGGVVNVPFPTQPSVAVQDGGGSTIAGDTRPVTLSKASGPGNLTCASMVVAAIGGVATFSGCKVDVAGTYLLSAAATGLSAPTNAAAFTVGSPAGAPTKLGFTTIPTGGITGLPFPTQPVVAVQDAQGNTVTTDNTTVITLTAVAAQGSLGTLTCNGGSPSRTVSLGVATFSGCSISAIGTYQLTATAPPALALTPAPLTTQFTIASFGSATKLAFTVQPGGGPVGTVWALQPVVAVQDQTGLTVTTDNSTVTLQVVSGPPGGTLTCTGGNSKAAVSGLATFAGCSLSVQGAYVIRAVPSAALTPADSTPVTIGAPGPALSTQLVVTVPNPVMPVGRSRLTFSGTSGTLNPTAVAFVIQRSGDSKYWNGTVGTWVVSPFENPATAATGSTGAWSYSVNGDARRLFAGTVVTVEMRGTVGTTQSANALPATLSIR